jgi:hypothetical protein
MPGAGHFPFNDDPAGFVATLRAFMAETEPAQFDEDRVRGLLLEGAPA